MVYFLVRGGWFVGAVEEVLAVSADFIVYFFLEEAEFDDAVFLSVMIRSFLVNSRDDSSLVEAIMALVSVLVSCTTVIGLALQLIIVMTQIW